MKPKVFFLLTLFLTVACTSVRAQENERALEVQHRNDCRLAAHVLAAKNPHPRLEWAQGIIGSCDPRTAVPALVSWWQVRSSGPSELANLHQTSRRFRDGRIYEAARSVAEDESRSPDARIAALGVLASYVEERINLSLSFLEPVRGIQGGWKSVWVWDSHSRQVAGEQPLPTGAAAEIVELVHTLKGAEQEPVRETARHLTYFPSFAKP